MIRRILIGIDPLAPDFEIIETNAPDSVILNQLKINAGKIEDGEEIGNPYGKIIAVGYDVTIIATSDDNILLDEINVEAKFYALAL